MRRILPALVCIALAGFSVSSQAEEKGFMVLVGENAWISDVQSISRAMDHENGMRVLPVLGSGSVQAIQDLQAFPNLEAALVTSDSLAYVRAQELVADEAPKLSYITAVKRLPLLLLAKRSIANVTGLAGKRIATGPADSASFAAGELLLGALEVPFLRVAESQEMAIDALLSGKADAALVLGTPANFGKLQATNFRILPTVLPLELSKTYQAETLTSLDAPGLLQVSEKIDGVSTLLVLAVSERRRNSAQNKQLKEFQTELFKQHTLGIADHLLTSVPGWQRFAQAANLISDMNLNASIQPTGAQP